MTELAEQPQDRQPRTGRHPQAEPVPFGPGSLLWDLAGDHRSNLVFLMPTLMQTMHPVIGDALARMPVATTDPLGRRTRSVDSTHLWIYGGEQAVREGQRLKELHKPVKGRDTTGLEVSALDPEVWAWVPLSGYPAFLTQCRVFGEPLNLADEVRLYEEVQNLARILGVHEQHIPPTVEAFWDYYQQMVSTRLTNHPYVHQVLAVARSATPPPGIPRLLRPVWAKAWPPIGRFGVWMTYGTFPPEMREILQIGWTARDERRFRLIGQAIRYLFRVLPEPLRYPATPRLARQLARAQTTGEPTALLQRKLKRRIATLHTRNTKSLT